MKIQILSDVYDAGGMDPAQVGDAGLDLRSTEHHMIHRYGSIRVPLGVKIELLPTTFGLLTNRSSLFEKNILMNQGVIDSGYRGELTALLFNLNSGPVEIIKGARIAQLLVVHVDPPTQWIVVDNLSESGRGEGGFGSTGEK